MGFTQVEAWTQEAGGLNIDITSKSSPEKVSIEKAAVEAFSFLREGNKAMGTCLNY
jgi:hypothetical protein